MGITREKGNLAPAEEVPMTKGHTARILAQAWMPCRSLRLWVSFCPWELMEKWVENLWGRGWCGEGWGGLGGIYGGCLRVRKGMGHGAMAHSTGVIGLGQCLMTSPEGRGLVACHMHRASYQDGRF